MRPNSPCLNGTGRRRHGLADRGDNSLSACGAATCRHLPWRHHGSLARRTPDGRRSVRSICRSRRAGDGGGCRCARAAAGTRLRENETWEDLFFRLLLERVEPRLGRAHPTFLTHWPAAQAALARRDPADPRVAERFELFVCGIELANAFVELTDAAEQRARFEAIVRGAMRCPAQTGRSMRTSSRPLPSACRHPPASRSVSTGSR